MAKLWIPFIALFSITSACSNGPESSTDQAGQAEQTPAAKSSAGVENPTLAESSAPTENSIASKSSNPGGATDAMAADLSAAFGDGMLVGIVMETMNAGGYTYVKLQTQDGELWAAGPPVEVAVGDAAGLSDTFEMKDFESATLNRTFDAIYFCSSIQTASTLKVQAGAAEASAPEPKQAATENAEIARAENGQTIGEVMGNSADYVGKEVSIRARVVKFTPAIMKKNWIHLQDGTGGEGQNDLTVTTSATAEVGDIVVMKGVLIADKDFGFGYKYDLIVEDAEITVQ